MSLIQKISFSEKVGYALGDGAANIAWRGVATFLFIFYTDVFGINPVAVGMLMLITRLGDGVTDVLMGIVGDRTETRYGKFRPWVLWTALPLGVILSLLFTAPSLSPLGKIVYAYVTYIIFTLVYTANNIPYGALMAVITGDDKERTVLGSYRMVGAFAGGMIVQGALLFLVTQFGNVNPEIKIIPQEGDRQNIIVTVQKDVDNARITTKDGINTLVLLQPLTDSLFQTPSTALSLPLKSGVQYLLQAEGAKGITMNDLTIIDQKKGYSYSIYLLSGFLAVFMFITFYTTRERVRPPTSQKTDLLRDLSDLIGNRPWLILLIIGMLFNVYNSIKQGITVIYFTHYIHNQLLTGSYLIGLMLASIAGAMITGPLGKKWGKKKLFIIALLFSAATNSLMVFYSAGDIYLIFATGMLSEFASAIFPTLFFAMLGDAADFSEFRNHRRATGLVYSAGSFATKFGGGIAGAMIGLVLGAFAYNGQDASSIAGAVPGIVMLMSWIPALVAVLAAIIMSLYPLNQSKMDEITLELNQRRLNEQSNIKIDS